MLLHFLVLATFAVCATAFLDAPRGVLQPTVMLQREPEKCCLPIEFHIRRHENGVMRNKRGDDLITEHSHMASDKKVLKVAKNATLFTENVPVPLHYSLVVDYHEKKVFFIDRVRDCSYEHKVHDLKWDSCIPEHAEYRGTAIIGSGNSNPGVRVHLWHWREGVEPETYHSLAVTEKDCTLVERMFNAEDKLEMAEYNAFVRFFDNEVGHVDPDVFKVPKECKRLGADYDAFMESLNKLEKMLSRKLYTL